MVRGVRCAIITVLLGTAVLVLAAPTASAKSLRMSAADWTSWKTTDARAKKAAKPLGLRLTACGSQAADLKSWAACAQPLMPKFDAFNRPYVANERRILATLATAACRRALALDITYSLATVDDLKTMVRAGFAEDRQAFTAANGKLARAANDGVANEKTLRRVCPPA